MKTTKCIAGLCIILAFTFNNVNAQKISGEDVFEVSYAAGGVECLGEALNGVITFDWWWLGTKYQEKVGGVLTGELSGDSYTLDWIYNDGSHFSQNVGNFGSTITLKLRRNGRLVGNVHITYHWTAVGEDGIKAEVDNYKFDCK